MGKSSPKGLKTLWEKEKLLVMSNFSFSHSVFKRLLLQRRKNQGLFGKGSKAFADDKIKVTDELKFVLGRVENIVGKGKKCWLHNVFIRLLTCIWGVVYSCVCVVKSQ